MVNLTQEEIWAFNIINTTVSNVQAELQRQASAQQAFIELLEIKYVAKFNPTTGQFEPKKKEGKPGGKQ